MNHGFTPSNLDSSKCRCGRNEVEHTARATCDACGTSGNCELFGKDLLLCVECYAKEKEATQLVVKSDTPAAVILDIARKIDNSIQLREDIYNAEMVSIASLRAALEADTSVLEKHFTLSKAISARYSHLSQVIEGNNTSTQTALNQQRALQTTWQELAKQLPEEQRNQIKLKDVNYKPVAPKLTKQVAPKVSKPYNPTLVKQAAISSGLPAEQITMICMRRNISPTEAVKIMKDAGW